MTTTYGTATALSGNFNSASNASYTDIGTIDFSTANVMDCFVEVTATAGSTPSGNQQVVLYARSSVDGTNFSDSGSSATIGNLRFVGTLSLTNTSAHRSPALALAAAFGGNLPPKVTLTAYNDAGVSMAASGCTGQYRTVGYS